MSPQKAPQRRPLSAFSSNRSRSDTSKPSASDENAETEKERPPPPADGTDAPSLTTVKNDTPDVNQLKAQIRVLTRQRVQQIKQEDRERAERQRALEQEVAASPLRFASRTAKTFADLERPMIQEMQRWHAAFEVVGMYNENPHSDKSSDNNNRSGNTSASVAKQTHFKDVNPLGGQWLINRALKNNKAPSREQKQQQQQSLRKVDGIPVRDIDISAFKPAFRSGAWKPGSTTCDGAFPKFVGTGRFARTSSSSSSLSAKTANISNAEHAAMFDETQFLVDDDDQDDGGYRPSSNRKVKSPLRNNHGNYNRPRTAILMTNSAVRNRQMSPQQRKERGIATLAETRHHVAFRRNDQAEASLRRREKLRTAAVAVARANMSPNGVFVISPRSAATSSPLASLYRAQQPQSSLGRRHPDLLDDEVYATTAAAAASSDAANTTAPPNNVHLHPESLIIQGETPSGFSPGHHQQQYPKPLSKPPSPQREHSHQPPQPASRPDSATGLLSSSSTPLPNEAAPRPTTGAAAAAGGRAVRFDEQHVAAADDGASRAGSAKKKRPKKAAAVTTASAAVVAAPTSRNRRPDLFYGD